MAPLLQNKQNKNRSETAIKDVATRGLHFKDRPGGPSA